MIDLHCHSTCSDGTLSPQELVAAAVTAGVSALALTDHETVAGVAELQAAAAAAGIEAVPAVEIAASWYQGQVHLIGLFIDPQAAPLGELLAEMAAHRQRRNAAMLARLAELALPLPATALPSWCGRMHIARAMVAQGYCATVKEAFDRWLGHGKPACMPRFLPLPARVIEVIHASGGISVWAHPTGLNGRRTGRIRAVARKLQARGLDALEAYYSAFSPQQSRQVQQVAAELGLAVSGGSDYHGANSPGVMLGHGRGELRVPAPVLEELRRLAEKRRRQQ